MKNTKHSKQKQNKKRKMNMYMWGQKNKKTFASIICLILVLGLLASLLQM